MIPAPDRLVGLVVKASTWRAADLWSIPDFPVGIIGVESFLCHTISGRGSSLGQGQVPGVMGSSPGLAGPVSVYCDWVR